LAIIEDPGDIYGSGEILAAKGFCLEGGFYAQGKIVSGYGRQWHGDPEYSQGIEERPCNGLQVGICVYG
jgi:hypothetical protein